MSADIKASGAVGFLARPYAPDGPSTFGTLSSQQPDDLLLTLTSSNLQVFARKTRNLGCTCLNESADRLLKSGFHCPHLHGGADYWPTELNLDITSIEQVLVTYRTVGAQPTSPTSTQNSSSSSSDNETVEQSSSVAARTRDCVLVYSSKASQGKLHLEFEHNLARGAFVDAITATTKGTVDVDYIDASEDQKRNNDSKIDTITVGEAISGTETNEKVFQTRRAALRSVAAGKILLALQITSEGEVVGVTNTTYGDPNVHFLLGTAMTLAQALDEPDILALSWLVSGFINFQRAKRAKLDTDTKSSAALALSQLQYAIKLARENSLSLILSFSLQCLADLVVSKYINQDDLISEPGSVLNNQRARLEMAQQWLTESALLLPKDADTTLKMQLHRKIAELAIMKADASTSSANDREPTSSENVLEAHALNLSSILLDPAGMRVANCPNGSRSAFKPLHPLAWLLLPPPKSANQQYKSQYCCVCLAGPSCNDNGRRLRVFFTQDSDITWLKNELTHRLQLCPLPSHHHLCNGSVVFIQDVFDSSDGDRTSTKALPSTTKLSTIATSDGHSLTAIVVAIKEGMPAGREQNNAATVLCSQCHTLVPLEEVESHSETCC